MFRRLKVWWRTKHWLSEKPRELQDTQCMVAGLESDLRGIDVAGDQVILRSLSDLKRNERRLSTAIPVVKLFHMHGTKP